LADTARLTPGDEAPVFSLPDADENEVPLSDYKGRRVIVYFYPRGINPGCAQQVCDFRDSLAEPKGATLVTDGCVQHTQRHSLPTLMCRIHRIRRTGICRFTGSVTA
jgi:peroxiredoxin